MTFFLIAVLAGVLTVLAPCILPLLPVVVGASEPGARRISRRAVVVIGTLAVSVVVFTLLLKVSTVFITIPPYVWTWFSGSVLALLGLTLVAPALWGKIPLVKMLARTGNKAVGQGYMKNGFTGDVLMGAALGPVFSTCSPTYLYIIATVLPASFAVGLTYLIGFVLGLVASLLLIAYFGQQLINRISAHLVTASRVKQGLGLLLLVLGIAIVFGWDKQLESKILDSGYGATILFEEGLINEFAPKEKPESSASPRSLPVGVPQDLFAAFPRTDWSAFDERISAVLNGGPGKDGIPAIDNPAFLPLSTYQVPGDVLAVVLKDRDRVKVYPYNILTWHEIVNDTVDGVPVAVTFCPLCGSAVVFERTLGDEVATFGVSGFLLESNMVMYDRATESLWQQSTGKGVAGKYTNTILPLVPFQLMTIGEIKQRYENAVVLSENTGHQRDYRRNPYAGYENEEELFFPVSRGNEEYHPKAIFVVIRGENSVLAVPWDALRAEGSAAVVHEGKEYNLSVANSELTVLNSVGELVPFYFEMWFSLVAQHEPDSLVVINPAP